MTATKRYPVEDDPFARMRNDIADIEPLSDEEKFLFGGARKHLEFAATYYSRGDFRMAVTSVWRAALLLRKQAILVGKTETGVYRNADRRTAENIVTRVVNDAPKIMRRKQGPGSPNKGKLKPKARKAYNHAHHHDASFRSLTSAAKTKYLEQNYKADVSGIDHETLGNYVRDFHAKAAGR